MAGNPSARHTTYLHDSNPSDGLSPLAAGLNRKGTTYLRTRYVVRRGCVGTLQLCCAMLGWKHSSDRINPIWSECKVRSFWLGPPRACTRFRASVAAKLT